MNLLHVFGIFYRNVILIRRSVPKLFDLDGDDDLDMVIGSESGDTFVYVNEGTPQAPSFVPDSSRTFQLPFFATPSFGDIDNDGAWGVPSLM